MAEMCWTEGKDRGLNSCTEREQTNKKISGKQCKSQITLHMYRVRTQT